MSGLGNDVLSQRITGTLLGQVATAARSVALAAGLIVAGAAGALAQATPEATPMAAECVAPEGAMAEMEHEMATPAATPASEADAAPVGTVADESISAEAIAAVENFTACYNTGDIAALVAGMTPEYAELFFGTTDAAQIEAMMAGMDLPPVEILDIGNAQTYDDGRVSVDVISMTGEHQYTESRIYLVQAGADLLVDGEEFLPAYPPGDSAVIAYTIPDDTSSLAFDQSMSSVTIPALILYGANFGSEPHFIQLISVPEEVAATPVAELPWGPVAGGEFVGSIVIEPGEREEMVLLDLTPGTYLLFDLMVPGSGAILTITEPEEEE